MKVLSKIIIMAAGLLVASCAQRDITVTTEVKSDGSCIRMVTFKSDSSVLVGATDSKERGALLTLDNWEKYWSIKGETEKHSYPMSSSQYDSIARLLKNRGCKTTVADTVLLCATREFQSAEFVAASEPLKVDGKPLEAQSLLERKFRWFYTYYIYSETFEPLIGKFPLALDDYLAPEAASFWFTGSPDIMQGYTPSEFKDKLDAIQTAAEKWLNACMLSMSYDVVARNYQKVKDAPVDYNSFIANRDAVIEFLNKNKELKVDKPLLLIDEFYNTDAYTNSLSGDSAVNAEIDGKFQLVIDVSSLDARYRIVMPGTIVDAGNGTLTDNVAEYRVTGSRLLPDKYTISVTSRKVNVWAVTLTAVLFITAVVLWLRKKDNK